MTQTGDDHQPLKSVASSMPVIALGGEIGCLTLVIVLAAAFGGIWLDRLLGTKPVLTIVFILGAAPLSLYLTYLLAMRAIKKVQPQSEPNAQNESIKEDETGD